MRNPLYVGIMIILNIFLVILMICDICDSVHTYNRVIMNMPDGTIVGAENVRIKDQDESWKIICEDDSVYIIEKENCVIFD